jgi:processive 1,2-diacylglycerol beta-glucosyltransferase
MRLLLFAANFGCGHLQAARAVAQAYRALDPNHDAVTVNLQEPPLQALSALYLGLLRWAPGLYRRLYHQPITPGTRSLIQASCRSAVQREIQRHQPETILATHPFPGLALAKLRQQGELSAPVGAVVTDWGAHGLWVHPGFDYYFVASNATKHGFERLGIPAERIVVTGIPVRPAFTAALPRSRRTATAEARILVMGGGLGLGPITEAVRSLAAMPYTKIHVTVVCGQNEALRAELTDLFADDPRFRILGYSQEIPQLMAEADLLITKPGGLSSAEALAMGLPLLLLTPLPGQEEENAAYLVETGAAKHVADVWIGRLAGELLFGDGAALAAMQAAAMSAGQPQAAHLIATRLMTARKGGRSG